MVIYQTKEYIKIKGVFQTNRTCGQPFFGLGRPMGGRPCSLLLLGVLLFAEKLFIGQRQVAYYMADHLIFSVETLHTLQGESFNTKSCSPERCVTIAVPSQVCWQNFFTILYFVGILKIPAKPSMKSCVKAQG